MYSSENYLTPQEEKQLLRIARVALERWVRDGECLDVAELGDLSPALAERHGAFVTLRHNGALRGCIGYTANIEPLASAVRDNAINAASRDSRFMPVDPEELPGITIEISALTPGDTPETPFKRVHCVDEIVIGRDGLCIRRPDERGGLLLPQVAVDQGWDVPRFLDAVCRKAGYAAGSWKEPGYELYRFSAQVFEETESGD